MFARSGRLKKLAQFAWVQGPTRMAARVLSTKSLRQVQLVLLVSRPLRKNERVLRSIVTGERFGRRAAVVRKMSDHGSLRRASLRR
jgi:hypothetical protein